METYPTEDSTTMATVVAYNSAMEYRGSNGDPSTVRETVDGRVSSAMAGRSRLGPGRWSQLFRRVCHRPRICRGHSSTPDRFGRISSWRLPLRDSDAEECR